MSAVAADTVSAQGQVNGISSSRELLRVDRLSRTFSGFTAVSELSFHIVEGEIVGLVGPNGAGKTTTFDLVTGFLKPSSGHIFFQGRDTRGLAPHRLAQLGMVRTFQHTRVFAELSVRQNVHVASYTRQRGGVLKTLFGAGSSETRALRKHVDDILRAVGLLSRQHHFAADLAYGEQRMLEIGLALAASPKLLLLDEPFAGMNEAESRDTMSLIHTIRSRNVAVLVIDHDMQTMARGCDRLVVMNHGDKLAEGAPAVVTRDPEVVQAYLGTGGKLRPPERAKQGAAAVLALDFVSVSYGRVRALRGLDMKVGRGEIVALVGANGAGKTTTLRAVSGLVPLAGGQMQMLGRNLASRSPAARVRDGLAHCPEGREIFPQMTVLENLELGIVKKTRPKKNIDPPETPTTHLEHVLRLFPRLQERTHQMASSLSGGEQQMLAIGRALMSSPEVLLLDEPTLGLSPLLAHEVAEALVRLNAAGLSLLLVEQNAALALAIAHRAYVLENGRVVLSGSAAEVREDDSVRRAYLGSG